MTFLLDLSMVENKGKDLEDEWNYDIDICWGVYCFFVYTAVADASKNPVYGQFLLSNSALQAAFKQVINPPDPAYKAYPRL